jgi:nicotinamidase/pyrazinamidase
MSPTKTVFVDIDTQHDFFDPKGALYVSGAEWIVGAVRRLFAYAKAERIPVISSVDAHAADDPEFADWPVHCVVGTRGAAKLAHTVLPTALTLEHGERREDLPRLLVHHGQLIIRKPGLDVFEGPPATDLVDQLDTELFVVFGVATEYCVKFAVEGLLSRGRNVALVTDAIRSIDPKAGEALIGRWTDAGVRTVTTMQVTGR